MADYNTLLAELQQAQGMSAYEWQQQTATPTEMPGGHPNLGYSDYRTSPIVRRNLPVPGSMPESESRSEPLNTDELIRIPERAAPSTGH